MTVESAESKNGSKSAMQTQSELKTNFTFEIAEIGQFTLPLKFFSGIWYFYIVNIHNV